MDKFSGYVSRGTKTVVQAGLAIGSVKCMRESRCTLLTNFGRLVLVHFAVFEPLAVNWFAGCPPFVPRFSTDQHVVQMLLCLAVRYASCFRECCAGVQNSLLRVNLQPHPILLLVLLEPKGTSKSEKATATSAGQLKRVCRTTGHDEHWESLARPRG
eukprot:1021103-Amphidinium_carterae.1